MALVAQPTVANYWDQIVQFDITRAEANALPTYTAQHDVQSTQCNLVPRKTLRGHHGKIYCMEWLADSKHLITGSQDGKLGLWNAESSRLVSYIKLQSAWIMSAAYNSNTSLAVTGGLDNQLTVYNLPLPTASDDKQARIVTKPAFKLSAHEGYLSAIKWVGDDRLLTASGDQTCILWDMEHRAPTQVFRGHTADVMSMSLNDEQNLLVTGGCDCTARLWDLRTSQCVMVYTSHEADVNSVKFFPDGRAFGSGSDDSIMRLFDIRSCGQIAKYENPLLLSSVLSIDFSKSGCWMFGGYEDKEWQVFDTLTGEQVKVSHIGGFHEDRISSLAVSPDGQALATASWDETVKVWA